MSNDDKAVELIVRTLDAWLLLNPVLTLDAVTAWLESVEAEVIDPILEAAYIDE